MSESSSENGVNRQSHLIQENVTSDDVERAIQVLKEFSNKKGLGAINNCRDLAQYAEGVGSALRTLVVSKGKLTPGEEVTSQARHSIKQAEGIVNETVDDEIIVVGVATSFDDPSREFVSIHIYPDRDISGLTEEELMRHMFHTGEGVTLPADRELMPTGPEWEVSEVSAYETVNGERVTYHPFEYSQDGELQRHYARVLQMNVRKALRLDWSPPTALPPDILEQFGE